ncbi:hypothetical protein EOL96_04820 [Candidatus Saccharibacteria bacterium]|nr:hypothetical protein [Candidatus Saccharibacteria bacterium]
MQINKAKKTKRQPSNSLFDEDFSAGFEDSKLDKFKPALKVFVGIIVLMTAIWGVSAYFGSTDTKNDTNKNYTADSVQQDDDSDSKLSQCIADADSKNPTPDVSDSNFYPKLISGYDAQLACYDKYPDADGSYRRSSVEYARESALDSSGGYKDTYVSSGGGGSSTTSKNSVTGCDYSLSEREYLACNDRYYAANSSPSNSSSSNTGETNAPSYTPPSSPSTPSNPPSNTGGSTSNTGQNDPYAALNACLAEANSMPTEASRARARQGCYENHTPRL